MASYNEVTFKDVKEGVETKTLTIIDVRNPDEVAAGKIPGSVNIPLPQVKEAFGENEDAFEKNFGIQKPSVGATNVVVHCMAGKRAAMAIDQLQGLGYNSLKWYSGSFSDWLKNDGPIEKP